MRKIGFIGVVVFLFLPSVLFAQGASVRLDNSSAKLSIPEKGSKAGTVKIFNQAGSSIDVKVYLEDWEYNDVCDGSKEFYPPASTPLSCANWITFNPSQITVPPYGYKEVNYVVKVPAGEKGGHYAVMFIETAPTPFQPEGVDKKITSGIGIAMRLGFLFYVEVKNATVRGAELSKFSVTKDKKDKSYLISADFKNTGNTYLRTQGTYHIMDKEGLVYARSEFNEVYTFPGNETKLISQWKEAIPKGKYDCIITVDIGKAQEEAELGRGPVITKESEIEIGEDGDVVSVGELN